MSDPWMEKYGSAAARRASQSWAADMRKAANPDLPEPVRPVPVADAVAPFRMTRDLEGRKILIEFDSEVQTSFFAEWLALHGGDAYRQWVRVAVEQPREENGDIARWEGEGGH